MNSSAKEFLSAAIADYNALFKTNFSVDSNGFQNYYRDLAKQVKAKEIDLLIVVGMFLTGFDAPTLNTLFVDKNLRYHGLMQAYSRTNRILMPPRPSATSSPSAIWSRRPSTPSPCLVTRTPRTWCWRKATRSTWKASPIWPPVRRGVALSRWCKNWKHAFLTRQPLKRGRQKSFCQAVWRVSAR
jgi:hypothetical protein